ncbi:MAG: restriction endonuclease subunit S, partial [Paludibacter sp.]|nr:restriction endonuclease subunit S [Paludibacter sp.]
MSRGAIIRFEDVLTIKNGKNQSKVENPKGKYPIYGSGGIMGYADDFICPENTVIVGRKGNINKPIFVSEKFWNVDTAFGLVANTQKLLPKYLYYFCENYDFEKLNTTVTIPSLTKSNLLKIHISMPNLETQKKIADVLDKAKNLIDLRKKQIEKMDLLIKSKFIEMFGDPVTNPKGWPTKELKDITSKIGSGATPRGGKESYIKYGICLIRSMNVHNGKFKYEELAHIDESQAKQLENVTV